MKRKNIIIGLALTLAIGSGVTVFAATTNNISTITNCINSKTLNTGMRSITGQMGYENVESVLKNKLGMNDSEITEARNSGKTMYEIAKEKGMSEEDFKSALLEEKYKAIDDAVAKGTTTKEQGEEYKTQIKNNMANATPGEGLGGRDGGRMGKGQRGKVGS